MNTKEIQEFARAQHLSERETQVFELLVRGTSHFREIAAALGISPNTVNNHLNNIFQKTRTNSKTELLALFLAQMFRKYEDAKVFRRTPQVLVVDDEEDLCESTALALRSRGLKVFEAHSAEEALRELRGHRIDCIIADIRMPGMDGMQLLKTIREQHGYFPLLIFVSGFSDYTLADIMDKGAVGFLEKPYSIDQLYRLILEQVLEEQTSAEGSTPEASEDADEDNSGRYHKLPKTLSLPPEYIGFGGIFLPLDEKDMHIGDHLDFKVKVPGLAEDPLSLSGEIVWERRKSEKGLAQGFGVRLRDLDPELRERIGSFARRRSNFSFIPLGRAHI